MTLPMALLDFVPVVLFIIAAIVLQRGLYDKMSKGAFSLLSAGTIMVISAGIMKATWKLLMALEICDFERLNNCFFPMQSVGFLLAGISVIALVFFPQEKKETAYAAAAPAVFQGTMIFVTLMILGCLGFCGGLGIYAARKKKTLSAVLFWVAFVLMLGMGYLSSRDFSESSMNWIAECVNVVGEGILLTASVKLFKD